MPNLARLANEVLTSSQAATGGRRNLPFQADLRTLEATEIERLQPAVRNRLQFSQLKLGVQPYVFEKLDYQLVSVSNGAPGATGGLGLA